jgi:ABC-type antimicrobial peptide transport system permease subunit
MNIRAALGAQASEVLGLIVRQSSVPIVAGAIGGVAGAIVIGGSIRSLLFGVGATDPRIISGVVVVVAGAGFAAALLAARQSTSIDPAAALRDQ